jgi:hypothetical protein
MLLSQLLVWLPYGIIRKSPTSSSLFRVSMCHRVRYRSCPRWPSQLPLKPSYTLVILLLLLSMDMPYRDSWGSSFEIWCPCISAEVLSFSRLHANIWNVHILYGEVFKVCNPRAGDPILVGYEHLRLLLLCILSVVAGLWEVCVLLELSVEIIVVSNEKHRVLNKIQDDG